MADEIEGFFERGVTDGLPVVPPTAAPTTFPWCSPSSRPRAIPSSTSLIIVNGPIRQRLGVNCAAGVFGPGYRANATIGRALRLIMINLGGTRAGQISMSTMGHPGRYTYCIGEYEEASPWEPLHVERGFAPTDSTVTLFSGESPFMVNDHLSRAAPQLVASLGWSAAGVWNHKSYPLYGHTLFVIGPEHAVTIGAEQWTKPDVRRYLYETIRRPARDLAPGPDGAETSRLKNLLADRARRADPEVPVSRGDPDRRRRRHGRALLGRRARLDGRRARFAAGDAEDRLARARALRRRPDAGPAR